MEDDILEITYRKPDRFAAHLENASKIVGEWPEWKQNILGKTKLFDYQKNYLEAMWIAYQRGYK